MFLDKVLLGITLAAPIGPVSLEIIRRGLSKGFLAAFLVVIGAVIGDGLCLSAAYFGLSSLTKYSMVMDLMGLLGATFLLYLGFSSIKDRHKEIHFDNSSMHVGAAKSILLGFALAVVNPLSLVFWISVFAASTAGMENITFLPNSLILLGVLIWSITLCTVLTFSKNLLNKKVISTIITLSSFMLIFYGMKYGYFAISHLVS